MRIEGILPLALKRLIKIRADASLSDAAKLLSETHKALLVVWSMHVTPCRLFCVTSQMRNFFFALTLWVLGIVDRSRPTETLEFRASKIATSGMSG
jgi:hypothetical protein